MDLQGCQWILSITQFNHCNCNDDTMVNNNHNDDILVGTKYHIIYFSRAQRSKLTPMTQARVCQNGENTISALYTIFLSIAHNVLNHGVNRPFIILTDLIHYPQRNCTKMMTRMTSYANGSLSYEAATIQCPSTRVVQQPWGHQMDDDDENPSFR